MRAPGEGGWRDWRSARGCRTTPCPRRWRRPAAYVARRRVRRRACSFSRASPAPGCPAPSSRPPTRRAERSPSHPCCTRPSRNLISHLEPSIVLVSRFGGRPPQVERHPGDQLLVAHLGEQRLAAALERSEERRVGKERTAAASWE